MRYLWCPVKCWQYLRRNSRRKGLADIVISSKFEFLVVLSPFFCIAEMHFFFFFTNYIWWQKWTTVIAFGGNVSLGDSRLRTIWWLVQVLEKARGWWSPDDWNDGIRYGGFLKMEVPKCIGKDPNLKCMITRGSPISGNLHFLTFLETSPWQDNLPEGKCVTERARQKISWHHQPTWSHSFSQTSPVSHGELQRRDRDIAAMCFCWAVFEHIRNINIELFMKGVQSNNSIHFLSGK